MSSGTWMPPSNVSHFEPLGFQMAAGAAGAEQFDAGGRQAASELRQAQLVADAD